jgi:hypothetical protein
MAPDAKLFTSSATAPFSCRGAGRGGSCLSHAVRLVIDIPLWSKSSSIGEHYVGTRLLRAYPYHSILERVLFISLVNRKVHTSIY